MLSLTTPILRKKFKIQPNQIELKTCKGDHRLVLHFKGNNQQEKQKQLQTLLSQLGFLTPRVDKLVRLFIMTLSATAVVVGLLAFLGHLPFGGLSTLLILSCGSFFLGDALLSMLIGIYCDRDQRRLSNLINAVENKTTNLSEHKPIIRFDYKTFSDDRRQLVFSYNQSICSYTVKRDTHSFPILSLEEQDLQACQNLPGYIIKPTNDEIHLNLDDRKKIHNYNKKK